MVDLKEKIEALKESEGKKFFDPKLQHIFPEKDFYLCTECNCFDFVLSIQKKNDQFYSKRIDI
ncbi:MAG: hypothetical protein IJ875_06440, partial [Solobacterium sp.]|nr:hypothetical protein [Solobacterium sp.]